MFYKQRITGKRKNNISQMETWLFIMGLFVYLITRFIFLPDFPIFFFTDEAIQSVTAADLINNGFRGIDGEILPTYFPNGGQYNLSLSVYWQIIPYLLFGHSIWVTRGVAALTSLVSAIAIGLILRNFLKLKFWWLGSILISLTPAWFLHSRTAFETTLMVTMYCVFLLFYLSYRNKNPLFIYPTLLFGALTFYAYSVGQVVIVFTCIFLLLSDYKYHWKQRNFLLPASLFLIALIVPYARFRFRHNPEVHRHLEILNSYWVDAISLKEKLIMFLQNYIKGINPMYWYLPNQVDLIRHQMKGMGHLLIFGFPFLIIGLTKSMLEIKKSKYRLFLIAFFASPTGAAIVDIAITRLLVFIIPAIILTAIGVDQFLSAIIKNKNNLFILSILLFTILLGTNVWITCESLINGPLWFDNYGLYGLQYGGKKLFGDIKQYLAEHPNSHIILSPSWANGTDTIARFFLGDPLPIQIGTIMEFTNYYKEIKPETVFVMLPSEYIYMLETKKFTDIQLVSEIPCPNQAPCFYFVKLKYIPNIHQVLENEIIERRKLLESTVFINEKPAKVQYSRLDINEIQQAFDKNEQTVIRTLESNPLIIQLFFEKPRNFSQITLFVGGSPTQATVSLKSTQTASSIKLSKSVMDSNQKQEIIINFEKKDMFDIMIIEILSVNDDDLAHVHLWEVKIE